MAVKEIGDPRLQALFGASDPRDGGVRPTIRLPRRGVPAARIAIAALLCAGLLFLVLNARRHAQNAPTVELRGSDQQASSWPSPPPLYIPPLAQPIEVRTDDQASPQPGPTAPMVPAPAPTVRVIQQPLSVPMIAPQYIPPPAAARPPHVAAGAPLVIDTGVSGAAASANVPSTSFDGGASQATSRMRASALANRSMTVAQGYLIPAVLETGFDSTKPGFARAIVSRDVRGFDGTNVLIPRGSRLIGTYRPAASGGQNRAVIAWTRLIRPDGMTIAMDAPAVDPVGRGGIPASVNTHFFARLGDALLESTFEIGRAFAGRAVNGPVVIVSGQTTAAAAQAVTPQSNYVPTLKVAPGKSISVFVAQDLDFSAAGGVR